MFFDKSKGAFRAGEANGTSWDDANVGASSIGLGPDTTASGWASTAMGFQTTASANASTAMGQNTIASGSSSIATGWTTNALGLNSTAMGDQTTASGSASTAIGFQTNASGIASTAMGYQTTASGIVSTAIGRYNTAPSYSETVLGTFATNYTPASISSFNAADRVFSVGNGTGDTARSNAMTILKNGRIGIGTDTPNASALLDLTSTNKGILVPRMTATQRTAITTPATSLLVYQTDASPGFWYYNGTAWANLGSEFKSIGGLVQNTTDTANDDFVFGSTSLADIAGTNDDNRMFFDKSKGAFRVGQAMGTQWDDVNIGNNSIAMGNSTTASGIYSTALGYYSRATFAYAVAMGQSSSASGSNSTAIGYFPVASGDYATAIGNLTIASGTYSTAMGSGATASGTYSTAMGSGATASGNSSTAMGDNNTAPSYGETALGTFTTTYTPASATAFNIADRIFSVGNGTSTTRSNAMTLFKNSNFVVGSDNLNDIAGTNDDNRLFFNKSKGALRSGGVTGTQWDDANVGTYSTAMGDNNMATSYAETVLGAYATNYSPVSTTAFNAADRIFSVGNGTSTTRSNAITILKNGRVGLGTDTPTKGLLEINGVGLGQGTLTVISHGNGAGTTALATLNGGTYGASAYSIWASGNIAATQFHAYSDARIKKILGVSDSANDLQTLEKIEITNYKMADSLQLGNKPIKKVIAQQVEKVYPQAVANNLTEVIPNIYKMVQIKSGWIDLVTDVKVGDKVKLLFDSGEKLVAVTEVSAKGFKVNVETEGPVFVYGKEVHDFRAVDYEALSMLNISATQELLKRIKELEADKTNLTTKVKDLEQNQASIDKRLEQLESFLLKNAASTIELTTNK
ncbi:MAG: hypothetical protein QM710_00920 [Flavobacterium sp.]